MSDPNDNVILYQTDIRINGDRMAIVRTELIPYPSGAMKGFQCFVLCSRAPRLEILHRHTDTLPSALQAHEQVHHAVENASPLITELQDVEARLGAHVNAFVAQGGKR